MNVEDQFQKARSKLLEADGKPICVQALWDGDTSGWFLNLSVVLEHGWFLRKQYKELYLSSISKGGDIRLFNGQVPPWPEAEIGKDIGNRLAIEFNAKFYFPSPDWPDDECPTWLNRKQGVNCVGCNKLIIPSWSQYRRKDMCYSCEIKTNKQST